MVNESVWDFRYGLLVGWWQSEKYFSDPEVQQQLKREFKQPEASFDSDSYLSKKEQMSNVESVAVHFRRKDYFDKSTDPRVISNFDIYAEICTPDYYRNAIELVKSRYPEAEFFCFSDDKPFLRELKASDYGVDKERLHIVDDSSLDDVQEMLLMSCCKHFIIANSSYSWWAAWLGE